MKREREKERKKKNVREALDNNIINFSAYLLTKDMIEDKGSNP